MASRVENALPVRDPRADDLRAHFHALFGGEELPVPVEAIAEDLLGLSVEEAGLGIRVACSCRPSGAWC